MSEKDMINTLEKNERGEGERESQRGCAEVQGKQMERMRLRKMGEKKGTWKYWEHFGMKHAQLLCPERQLPHKLRK